MPRLVQLMNHVFFCKHAFNYILLVAVVFQEDCLLEKASFNCNVKLSHALLGKVIVIYLFRLSSNYVGNSGSSCSSCLSQQSVGSTSVQVNGRNKER